MNRKLITGVLAVTAIALSTSACQPKAAPSSAQSGSAASSGAPSGTSGSQQVTLQGMPSGTVTVTPASNGLLQAHVVVSGLTPGSSHDAAIDGPNSGASADVVRFPSFTADSTGRADATLTSLNAAGNLSAGDRFTIGLGASGGTGSASVATEAIAQSDALPTPSSATPLPLHAVDVDATGNSLGQLGGNATLAFNSAAHTLTVTVNATGLTPGAHAAHIHLGSCEKQGGVKYMLEDLQADAHGNVANESRVINDVTSAPPASGWYLNVHQGAMSAILANGAPTPSFRPMLCGDIK